MDGTPIFVGQVWLVDAGHGVCRMQVVGIDGDNIILGTTPWPAVDGNPEDTREIYTTTAKMLRSSAFIDDRPDPVTGDLPPTEPPLDVLDIDDDPTDINLVIPITDT